MKKAIREASFRTATVVWATTVALAAVTGACGKNGGRKGAGFAGGGATDPQGSAAGADKITPQALPRTEVFTKDSVADSCVKVSFLVTARDKPQAGAEVVFTVNPTTDFKEAGTVGPATAKSGEDGIVTTSYCSDKAEGKVTIGAKAGPLTANSGEITITRKPTFEFKFVRSDAKVVIAAGGGEKATDPKDTVLKLNLADSGPNDCTFLYFQLTKSGAPVVGETVRFRSQVDYPKGAKFAKKKDPAVTDVEGVTAKKFLYADALSNTAGEFAVPVCAGVDLGSMVATGTFHDQNEAKDYVAQSPVITIVSGITNYANLTLNYDFANAKTLKGYFENNTPKTQKFSVKLGARFDGDPITDYPVSIFAEFGKLVVANGGVPSADTGTVDYTLQPLHMADYRPYQVKIFNGAADPLDNSAAQTRCDALALSRQGSDVLYKDLKLNWRSTIVYAVRGQEFFYDANGNGLYDEGGDGFWDKNQNGVFDAGDVLTHDGGAPGFDINSEWFIDLPSPFVDVNEDGIYTPNVDRLVGDVYVAPNGKRDADALIWKYDYVPIYMGTSGYAMRHAVIKNGAFGDYTDTIGAAYFAARTAEGTRPGSLPSPVLFYNNVSSPELFGYPDADNSPAAKAAKIGTGHVWRYIFAHGVCGNAPPGGTELRVDFAPFYKPEFGAREFSGHFFIQPGDNYIEPARRFLNKADGNNVATVNYNAVEHKSAAASYPVEFRLSVTPCNHLCAGPVSVAGYSCDARIDQVNFSMDDKDPNSVSGADTISIGMSIPAVVTCSCAANASLVKGDCVCNAGYTANGNSCDPS